MITEKLTTNKCDNVSEKELIEVINRLNKTVAMLAIKGQERDQQIKTLRKIRVFSK